MKKRKKIISGLLAIAMIMSLYINIPAQAQEITMDAPKHGKEMQGDIPWIFGMDMDFETGEIIYPDGVSYDGNTNTLTLENANIRMNDSMYDWEHQFISVTGDKMLTIKLLGKNFFRWDGDRMYRPAAIREEYGAKADVKITGGGSLELTGGSLLWDQSYNGDAGDLYVDGVTLISDGEGFMSQYSNITIKNATVTINNKRGREDGVYSGSTFGLCTGRIDGNYDDTFEDGVRYEGLLTVENSDIEIKNCLYPIAANEIKLAGCSLYGGISSPEHKLDYKRLYLKTDGGYGGAERYYYLYEYMKISTADLGLPEAYNLDLDFDEDHSGGCMVLLPDFAVEGERINTVLELKEGWRLKAIYVNGERISGTTFTMPAKDTIIKVILGEEGDTSEPEEPSEPSKPSDPSDITGSETKVSKITITGMSKKIAAGKKIRLNAEITPSSADNKKVIWTTSDSKVAKVNASGIVTMNKNSGGKSVTITATAADGSKAKATYRITSMKGAVKKIAISGKKTVKAGRSLKLSAKVTASKKANKTLKWTSSNKKYATVSRSGKVKTLKDGKGKKVKITAAATDGSGKKKAVTIKIK